MAGYYNRYEEFNSDDVNITPPMVKLSPKSTDEFITYILGTSRLDKISQEYYEVPFYGFLILAANPEFTKESDIPNNTQLRIPLPFNESLSEYKRLVQDRIRIYGR